VGQVAPAALDPLGTLASDATLSWLQRSGFAFCTLPCFYPVLLLGELLLDTEGVRIICHPDKFLYSSFLSLFLFVDNSGRS